MTKQEQDNQGQDNKERPPWVIYRTEKLDLSYDQKIELAYNPEQILRELKNQARQGGFVDANLQVGGGPYWNKETWQNHCRKVESLLVKSGKYNVFSAKMAIFFNSFGVILVNVKKKE
jgi:hypothetical protein